MSSCRQSSRTIISTVDLSKIHFTPSPSPLHPYDSPTLEIDDASTSETLQNAADLLSQGKCVAFPTETVYGLGADATSTMGVKSIFAAKQRPLDNPLIVHFSSLRQLRRLLLPPPTSGNAEPNSAEGEIPEFYIPLINKFWPGPLTILLPLPSHTNLLSASVTAGQPTFAARLPEHPIALALCALSDLPLAAPSANASGNPSPTIAAHVYTDLRNRIPLIIDGGSCSVGLESTVVDGLHYPPVVLRPGGVSVEDIRALGGVWAHTVVSSAEDVDDNTVPQAPGMKYKHYAPRAGVVLYEFGAKPPTGKDLMRSRRKAGVIRTRTWKEGLGEGEGEEGYDKDKIADRDLGTDGRDIGRGLFARLRELDDLGVDVIYVEGIEEAQEGLAVMNRLRKAASVVVRNVGR